MCPPSSKVFVKFFQKFSQSFSNSFRKDFPRRIQIATSWPTVLMELVAAPAPVSTAPSPSDPMGDEPPAAAFCSAVLMDMACVRSGHWELTWEFTRNFIRISYTKYQKCMHSSLKFSWNSRKILIKFFLYSSMPTSEPRFLAFFWSPGKSSAAPLRIRDEVCLTLACV